MESMALHIVGEERSSQPFLANVCMNRLIVVVKTKSVGPADESSHYKNNGRKPSLGISPL